MVVRSSPEFQAAGTGLSGSCWVCQRPPSPFTPESPTAASARCFTVGVRLHHFREAGRSRLCNEAGTSSRFRITADIAVFPGFARQVAPPHAGSTSWGTSNYHDRYLSTDKTQQTYPDAPKEAKGTKTCRGSCSAACGGARNRRAARAERDAKSGGASQRLARRFAPAGHPSFVLQKSPRHGFYVPSTRGKTRYW